MDDSRMLVLVVPGDIRDDVVDTLMACDGISGFNMATTAGYSKEHSQYSLREQVEGFRTVYEFQVIHHASQQGLLLDALREVCHTARVRYWIMPLQEFGHL